MDNDTRIVLAEAADREVLVGLIARIEAEDHPDDQIVVARAPAAARRSLEHYDILSSDAAWCLLAYTGNEAVGLAVLSRVPKLDDRFGFLYLDELHVLEPWRRQGIGRKLLERSTKLSRELRLAGVRLLTRIENAAARALYESIGFHGGQSMIYQCLLDRENTES